LSKEEVWRLLNSCQLLKHKILIGLLYGCGLRCMEVRSVRFQNLDFDRLQLKVVQRKGKKDRYVPLSIHLVRGLKMYIGAVAIGDRRATTFFYQHFGKFECHRLRSFPKSI